MDALAERQERTNELLAELIEVIKTRPILPAEQVENGKFSIYHYDKSREGIKKRSPKVEMVVDWLKVNPDKVGLSNREIARLLDVTHPTVAQAKQVLRGG